MTELTEFRIVNTSPTTLPQQRLISTLAHHFNIPVKIMRAGLDLEAAKEDRLVKFDMPDNPLMDQFYVINLKLNIKDFLDTKRFVDSKLFKEYVLMLEDPKRSHAIFTIYDTALYVLYDMDMLDMKGSNVAGIYLNHKPDFIGQIMLPINTFLRVRYNVD